MTVSIWDILSLWFRHAGGGEGGQRRVDGGLVHLGGGEQDDDRERRVGSLKQAAAGAYDEGQ